MAQASHGGQTMSWAWGDPDNLSDVLLVIKSEGMNDQDESEITVNAHALVLGTGSEFFKSKIQRWRRNRDTNDDGEPIKKKRKLPEGSRQTCRIELLVDHRSHLAAAHEAVRYLYFNDLSEEVKGDAEMLLQVNIRRK